MFRADHATRLVDANGSGKDGYGSGDPGVTPATVVTADALNSLQEELCRAIEAAGITLDKTKLNQLARVVGGAFHTYTFSADGSTVSNGGVVFTSLDGDSGFSIVGSREIAVPIPGWYEVSVSCFCGRNNASDPTTSQLNLKNSGDSTHDLSIANRRFSATANENVLLSGVAYLHLTNVSTHKIGLSNPNAETLAIADSRMNVRLIRAD
jgi:hypothetical protein